MQVANRRVCIIRDHVFGLDGDDANQTAFYLHAVPTSAQEQQETTDKSQKKERRKEKMKTEREKLSQERIDNFDSVALACLIVGKEYLLLRRKMTQVIKDNPHVFPFNFEANKEQHRKRVTEQVRFLVKYGHLNLSLLRDDPLAYNVTCEALNMYDASIPIKAGVHFQLFGGTLLNLGTKRHFDKFFNAIDAFQLPGCFMMTELGHGSNVQGVGTTAVYDKESQEYVINTPSDIDRKWWIGHASEAKAGVVFADLIVNAISHGVHAFIVPLRHMDSDKTLPGVQIGDCGYKMGLNGVDNGWMKFADVRIPREHLLNRFADVTPDGAYVSPIKSDVKRFGRQLAALTLGRCSLVGGSSNMLSLGITIAIRFAARRHQFGPPGEPEQPILDYISHQRRLMPMLANCYAQRIMAKHLVELYKSTDRNDDAQIGELHSLSAGVKALCTWYTNSALQICRECCGGQGYAAYNRFSGLRNDQDIYQTFEGDNTVLMQQVAKDLLNQYQKQFKGKQFSGMLRYLGKQMNYVMAESNPITTNMKSWTHLRTEQFQKQAFAYRVAILLHESAMQLQKRSKKVGMFTAWNQSLPDLLQVAKAHVERVMLKQFINKVKECEDPSLRAVLKLLCDLYALSIIEKDIAVFFKDGYIKKRKAKAIRNLVTALCQEVRRHALGLVDAFDIDDALVHSPLGLKHSDDDPLTQVVQYVQAHYTIYP